MKIFVRIMYGILVVLISFVVFSEASFKRTQNFYLDSAVNNMKEGHLDEFVDDTMLITGATRYLKQPIYRITSEDSQYSFDLTIYHFQKIIDKKINSGIIFYVSNFKSNEEVDGILFRFISESSNKFVDTKITMYVNDLNIGGNVVDPILFSFDENQGFIFNNTGNETITLSEIKEIELRTLTIDGNEQVINDNVFATIKHSKEHQIEESNEFQFVRNNDVLVLNNFNGNILEYKQFDDNYTTENEGNEPFENTDITKLEPYNDVISRTIWIFVVTILITTYFLFFLKPTINKIKEIRLRKQPQENEENDAKSID